MIKAINTYVTPVLIFSFRIVKWMPTDLENLQTKTRTLLTRHRFHYSCAAKERPLSNLKNRCFNFFSSWCSYFLNILFNKSDPEFYFVVSQWQMGGRGLTDISAVQ